VCDWKRRGVAAWGETEKRGAEGCLRKDKENEQGARGSEEHRRQSRSEHRGGERVRAG
jgi:hypothetical protein